MRISYLNNKNIKHVLNWLQQSSLFRVVFFLIQELKKGYLATRAAHLTYYSLLSLVPVLILCIPLLRILAIQEGFLNHFLGFFLGPNEVIQDLLEIAESAWSTPRPTGIIGLILLLGLLSSFQLLRSMELAILSLWNLRAQRSYLECLYDMMVLFLLFPLVLISGLMGVRLVIAYAEPHTWISFVGGYGIAFLCSWFVITFLYRFIPNTKIPFLSSFFIGGGTALCYQGLQFCIFSLQLLATRQSILYGTFAAFPLFIIWIYLSWMLILLGGKLCFGWQYEVYRVAMYSYRDLPHDTLLQLSIQLSSLVTCAFRDGAPLSLSKLSLESKIPLYPTEGILFALVEAKILYRVKDPITKTVVFLPAHPIKEMSVGKVIEACNSKGFYHLHTHPLRVHWQHKIGYLFDNQNINNILLVDL